MGRDLVGILIQVIFRSKGYLKVLRRCRPIEASTDFHLRTFHLSLKSSSCTNVCEFFSNLQVVLSRAPLRVYASQADGRLLWWMYNSAWSWEVGQKLQLFQALGSTGLECWLPYRCCDVQRQLSFPPFCTGRRFEPQDGQKFFIWNFIFLRQMFFRDTLIFLSLLLHMLLACVT